MGARRDVVAGPLVAVCRGARCAALRALRGTDDEPLRQAVRGSRGAVLVGCGCLGRCDLASVVLVGWHGGPDLGTPLTLAGMDDDRRSRALGEWLTGSGPEAALVHGAALPATLALAATDASGGR